MKENLYSPIPQRFNGSCHCGAIRFQVWVKDFTVIACNCSICQKKGFLHLIVPPEQFELLQGSDFLQTYTFNTGTAKHHFCKTCGIAPFYRPRSHPNHLVVQKSLERLTSREYSNLSKVTKRGIRCDA